LWALRYPGQHALHIFERPAGTSAPAAASPGTGSAGLHVRSTTSSVHAPALHSTASVVVASEQLDGESGWRMLTSGELVHVRPDLTIETTVAIPEPPARLLPV
jgi:glutamine amidotransferase